MAVVLNEIELNARKNYIIFVSDEIAMFSFLDILKSYGFDYWFPNFWEKMREKNIYFVQIVSEYNDPSSSLDWPIILHEMAHIVCDQKEIDRKFIPEMTVLEALQTVYHASERQGIPDAIVIQAKKKLYKKDRQSPNQICINSRLTIQNY